MVIGENNKESDVEVNITKSKHLTNIRTHAHEEKIVLTPPRVFTVEEAVSYIRGKHKKKHYMSIYLCLKSSKTLD